MHRIWKKPFFQFFISHEKRRKNGRVKKARGKRLSSEMWASTFGGGNHRSISLSPSQYCRHRRCYWHMHRKPSKETRFNALKQRSNRSDPLNHKRTHARGEKPIGSRHDNSHLHFFLFHNSHAMLAQSWPKLKIDLMEKPFSGARYGEGKGLYLCHKSPFLSLYVTGEWKGEKGKIYKLWASVPFPDSKP